MQPVAPNFNNQQHVPTVSHPGGGDEEVVYRINLIRERITAFFKDSIINESGKNLLTHYIQLKSPSLSDGTEVIYECLRADIAGDNNRLLTFEEKIWGLTNIPPAPFPLLIDSLLEKGEYESAFAYAAANYKIKNGGKNLRIYYSNYLQHSLRELDKNYSKVLGDILKFTQGKIQAISLVAFIDCGSEQLDLEVVLSGGNPVESNNELIQAL